MSTTKRIDLLAGSNQTDMSEPAMSHTNLVSIEEIVAGLKKATEAVKKQPGLMKSSVDYRFAQIEVRDPRRRKAADLWHHRDRSQHSQDGARGGRGGHSTPRWQMGRVPDAVARDEGRPPEDRGHVVHCVHRLSARDHAVRASQHHRDHLPLPRGAMVYSRRRHQPAFGEVASRNETAF